MINPNDDYIEWAIESCAAGSYELKLTYALDAGNRPLMLTVNSIVKGGPWSFPATGSFSTWVTVAQDVVLLADSNTVRLSTTGFSGANIDKLSITEKATLAPTPAPTSAPTPAPTLAATTAITGFGRGVSAVGDPHLQNIHGERFDLMKPGKHNLITIPRKPIRYALLRVDAEAHRLGGKCDDIYFQEVNITGAWADAKKTGGFRHRVRKVPARGARWVRFGNVQLKVAHGRTSTGIKYLNLYVKGLDRAGTIVGGLLGEDDHSLEEIPSESCRHRVAL
jgi:hypothetical protein